MQSKSIRIRTLQDKMEDYILIAVAMKAAVDENTVPNLSLGSLLDNLIAAIEREI